LRRFQLRRSSRHGELVQELAGRSRSPLQAEYSFGSRARSIRDVDGGGWLALSGGRGPMIPLPTGVRVWLATGHTDMRRASPALRSWCRRC